MFVRTKRTNRELLNLFLKKAHFYVSPYQWTEILGATATLCSAGSCSRPIPTRSFAQVARNFHARMSKLRPTVAHDDRGSIRLRESMENAPGRSNATQGRDLARCCVFWNASMNGCSGTLSLWWHSSTGNNYVY